MFINHYYTGESLEIRWPTFQVGFRQFRSPALAHAFREKRPLRTEINGVMTFSMASMYPCGAFLKICENVFLTVSMVK